MIYSNLFYCPGTYHAFWNIKSFKSVKMENRLKSGSWQESSIDSMTNELFVPSQPLRLRYSKMTAILRILDTITIYSFFYLSAYLTTQSLLILPLNAGVVALCVFVFFAEYTELYCERKPQSLLEELGNITVTWGLTALLVTIVSMGLTGLYESPLLTLIMVWLFFSPALVVMMYGYRRIAALIEEKQERQHNLNIAIVGTSTLVSHFMDDLSSRPGFEYKTVKYYDERQSGRTPEKIRTQLKQSVTTSYGNLNILYSDAKSNDIDIVYIAFPLRAEARIKEIIEKLSDSTSSVFIVPNLFSLKLLSGRLSNVNGLPLISVFDSPFQALENTFKRCFDLVFSMLALVVFSIPMLLISIAVKINSPGSILFKQKRYGIHGEEIEIWKFRSMSTCENNIRVIQAIKNDPRVTSIGRILRKTSLDELPQFFNVFMGTMSVVGPRPHAVVHNEYYRKRIKGYMLRHKVKPGITGLAQVKGFRGETDTLDKMEGRIHYDLKYIQEWTLLMDIQIITLTCIKGFSGDTTY